MAKRLLGWWFFAEETLGLLSAPLPDLARSDREVEAVIRDSRLFSAARAFGAAIARAWADSALIAAVKPLGADLFAAQSAVRVRVVAVIAFVAAVTAGLLQMVKPISPGPLTAILPALVAAAAVLVAGAAAPIARALEDKTR